MLLRFFLVLWLTMVSVQAQDVKTFIPEKAKQYLPLIYGDVNRLMPGFEYPYYFGSLIEHESCISLKHSRCWAPTSELKTSREQGVGLGQLTRTWKADGSVRFDKLTEMKNQYRAELKELSWLNIKQRPDLQIRAIILMTRDNYKALYQVKDPFERLKMADYAYNGGLGAVKKDRTHCGLQAGCDPQYWDGHVEIHSVKSRKVLYGKRSAFDITRHHVHDVTHTRLPKYRDYFKKYLMPSAVKFDEVKP